MAQNLKVAQPYANAFVEMSSGKDVISDLVCIKTCLLYTSPSPRDVEESRMPSSA